MTDLPPKLPRQEQEQLELLIGKLNFYAMLCDSHKVGKNYQVYRSDLEAVQASLKEGNVKLTPGGKILFEKLKKKYPNQALHKIRKFQLDNFSKEVLKRGII